MIEQALRYLLTPDGLKTVLEFILGIGLSFAADWIPGFTAISARAKRLYMFLGCLLLPSGAVFSLGLLFDAAQPADAFFGALLMGLLVFVGSQVGHTPALDTRTKAEVLAARAAEDRALVKETVVKVKQGEIVA